VWLAWLAQQSTAGPDVIGPWIQYGSLGLVIVMLLTGWLWAKPAVDRQLREIDRLNNEQGKQIEALIGEVHQLRGEVHALREGLRRERPG
jgi:hypothetical protein